MKPCPLCAEQNPDDGRYCRWCNADLSQPADLQQPAPITEEGTNGKAIGSLVCGVFFIFLPAAIAAIILGHISRSEIRRSAGRLRGSGMALAGLILGYLGASVLPVLIIIAAIAIPNLLRSRMAANEATAVGSLRTLYTACVTYYSTYGTYPAALANLGPSDNPSAEAADLIDMRLVNGQKSGYAFSYLPTKYEGEKITAFTIVANPIVSGSTGTRHFYTDETLIIRWEMNKPASVESPPLGQTEPATVLVEPPKPGRKE